MGESGNDAETKRYLYRVVKPVVKPDKGSDLVPIWSRSGCDLWGTERDRGTGSMGK